MSRLVFHCQHCGLRGDRAESYKPLPGKVPSFTDVCPRCNRDEIEVSDPVANAAAKTHDERN